MDIETVVFSDLQPNFLNLSLLICQLFAGGNFRMAHILYDQEAFDDRFLNALDSACPLQIPKMTIEVSVPETLEPEESQRTDHILQLIFLPRTQIAQVMDRIGSLLTFYRVFIFSSTSELDAEYEWSRSMSNPNTSSLLLIHNSSSGATRSYLLSKNLNTSMESVDLRKDQSRSDKDIFDSALGEKALARTYGVSFPTKIGCSYYVNSTQAQLKIKKTTAISALYFNRLNMSYMDALTIHCNGSGVYMTNETMRPISKSSYRNLSPDFEPIRLEPK